MDLRVLSGDGAAFALLPLPDPTRPRGSESITADVELLTPDRLVRHLARPFDLEVLGRLAETWLRCGSDLLPEQSVETLEHAPAGLSVRVVGSSERSVVLEVVVVVDLDDGVPEVDGINAEFRRATLVRAAIELREWVEDRRSGVTPR